MKFPSKLARVLALILIAGVLASCATTPPTAQNEGLLTAAGFKTVVASTDKQLQDLPTLPAGQVTVGTQTGKNWFVYPDLPKNRVYVGTQKEYRAYLDLRAQNGLPDVDPMAAYYKRDQAMTSALPRDATTPPSWEWWPMFDQMGFQ